MQWTRGFRSVVSWVALTAVVGAGCSSIQSSATPPSQTTDLTGTWRGNFAVQTVTSEMVWTLTQSGTSVSGPAPPVMFVEPLNVVTASRRSGESE